MIETVMDRHQHHGGGTTGVSSASAQKHSPFPYKLRRSSDGNTPAARAFHPVKGCQVAPAGAPLKLRSLAYVAFKDLTAQMRPCANPWCSKFSHRKDKLCAACQEITGGIFVENMLIHLSWSPATWRLRVSLSAAELMWSPAGSWEMQALPGSPFPTVVKAVSVSNFALGGRLMCRLPAGQYSVAWRLSRAPTNEEMDKANKDHRVWGLQYSHQNCFSWMDPNMQAKMRYTTSNTNGISQQSPLHIKGMMLTEDTVQMLPNWTEIAIGMIELGNPNPDDSLCSLVLETELHCCSLVAQGGLYIDGVVVSQLKETDCRKLFNSAPKVIRQTKSGPPS